MANYKLIIFDFDGTLADSFQWFLKALNSSSKKFRFKEIQGHEIENLRKSNTEEIIKYLGITWWKRPFIAAHMRKQMRQELTTITLFNGVEEMLQDLSKEVRLAILSSNSKENILTILGSKNAKLIDHFECGVSLYGKGAKIRKLLKETKFTEKEAIYVGDETRDYEAASKENVAFGAVLWGYATHEALLSLSPTHAFSRPHDIASKLGKVNEGQ